MAFKPNGPLIPPTGNFTTASIQKVNGLNTTSTSDSTTVSSGNTLMLSTVDNDNTAGSIILKPGTGTDANGSLFFNINGNQVYKWPTSAPPGTNYAPAITSVDTVDGITTYTMGWVYVNFICFHKSCTVMLQNGTVVTLDKLRYQDRVLTVDKNMKPVYSKVIDFTGVFPNMDGAYVKIYYSDSYMMLSGNHLLYCDNTYKQAKDITEGMKLMTVSDNGDFRQVTVTKVECGVTNGWYTPLTSTGTIVINGVIASCHTTGPHDMVHFMYKPLHAYRYLFPRKAGEFPKEEKHFYSIRFRRGAVGRFIEKILLKFNWKH